MHTCHNIAVKCFRLCYIRSSTEYVCVYIQVVMAVAQLYHYCAPVYMYTGGNGCGSAVSLLCTKVWSWHHCTSSYAPSAQPQVCTISVCERTCLYFNIIWFFLLCLPLKVCFACFHQNRFDTVGLAVWRVSDLWKTYCRHIWILPGVFCLKVLWSLGPTSEIGTLNRTKSCDSRNDSISNVLLCCIWCMVIRFRIAHRYWY